MLHMLKYFVGGSREENKEKFLEVIQWAPDLHKPVNAMILFLKIVIFDGHSRIFF